MRRTRLAIGILCVSVTALALPGTPALGQRSQIGAGLRNHDTNAPVDIGADRIEVQDRANRAIISGNVDVRQAQLRMRAERVTVTYAGGADAIRRIDAAGGVVVTSPTETIRGSTGIYDLERKIITLLGDVTLQNPDGTLNGGRLVYDLETGRAVMDGGTAGAPGSSAATTGRVTGRFTVPQT